MDSFRITIATLPDRYYPVVEIFYHGMQWAEISQESDDLIIQFYSPFNETCWEFPLDEALKTLEQAKVKLLS